MNFQTYPLHKHLGFTLVEIAIVLLIVALLLGGLVPTLSGQIEQRRNNETSKQLDEIQQALIGFAVMNGRLPCPASSASNGQESFCTNATGASCTLTTTPPPHGRCSNFFDGYVPAAALGITSVVDSQGNKGYAVDSWGSRIHYAVSSWNSSNLFVFTSSNGMKTVGISNPLTPNLLVCSTAPVPASPGTSCNTGTSLTPNYVPAVIFSTGKNGPQGNGADESANLDGNLTFVSHTPALGSNQFDDLVIWISPNTLINRMVAAGQLP